MCRGLDQFARAPAFDHVAAVKYGDMVGHLGHHGKVVGHEDHRRALFGDLATHELQDLALDRHIKRCGGLIRDDQPGPRQ